jgi:hypothetical protein
MYPRVVRLEHSGDANGRLLATFERYTGTTLAFPIFESTDDGATWTQVSEVTDQHYGWGMRYQPMLYELPREVGDMPAGTLLAAGNAIPDDLSRTSLEVYKSTDHGRTWSYLSTITTGGRAEVDNDAVWEPFLMLDRCGRLVAFYSDERHKADGYNQLLAHQVSSDGVHWGPEVYDVAIPDDAKRPGMAVVSRLPNGRYFMTFEVVGGWPNGVVHFKRSRDGTDWGDPRDLGTPLVASDGTRLRSMPYNAWSPAGGEDGTLLAGAQAQVGPGGEEISRARLFANRRLGRGRWTPVPAPVARTADVWCDGWSAPLVPSADGSRLLELASVSIGPEHCRIDAATAPTPTG